MTTKQGLLMFFVATVVCFGVICFAMFEAWQLSQVHFCSWCMKYGPRATPESIALYDAWNNRQLDCAVVMTVSLVAWGVVLWVLSKKGWLTFKLPEGWPD